jgi:membrane-associated phospholipid phosphatase
MNRSIQARTELKLLDPSATLMPIDGSTLRLKPQLCLAIGLAAFLPFAPFVDYTVAMWFSEDPLPGDLLKALHLCEIFAHGVGIMLILIGLACLVPSSRWYLPRIAAIAYGSGAIVTLIKMFVTRPRPNQLLTNAVGSDGPWRWNIDWMLERLTVDDESFRSFPSGHAATAVGLAVGLSLLFPRGRYLFWFAAVMASAQRLHAFAHYFSDVLAGWIIGLTWSAVCLHPRLLGGLFSRFEPRPETWSQGGLSTGERTTYPPNQQAA